MTRHLYGIGLLILHLLLLAPTANAFLHVEAGGTLVATGNAWSDSSRIADHYSDHGLALGTRLPGGFELSCYGDLHRHADIVALDRDHTGLELALRKRDRDRRSFLSATLFHRRRNFRDEAWLLDSRSSGAALNLRHYPRPELSFRLELDFADRRYPDFELADNRRSALAGGTNFSLPTGSSLDLELSLDRRAYGELVTDRGQGRKGENVSVTLIGLQARLAQSIGARNGLSLGFWNFAVADGEDDVLALPDEDSISMDLLPFAERGVNLKLKRIFGRGFTGRGWVSWSRREYLGAFAEQDDPDLVATNREDESHRGGLLVWKSIRRDDLSLEPSLGISFGSNESSNGLYDYESWEITLGLELGY